MRSATEAYLRVGRRERDECNDEGRVEDEFKVDQALRAHGGCLGTDRR